MQRPYRDEGIPPVSPVGAAAKRKPGVLILGRGFLLADLGILAYSDGDTREVAVTQADFGQLLLQQGEHARALPMLWDSAVLLDKCGYAGDAETMRQILTIVKTSIMKTQRFDQIWREAIGLPQPDWLRERAHIAGLDSDRTPP